MSPLVAKTIFIFLVIGWYCIRLPYEWEARRTPVARSARTYRELAIILAALLGLGTVPTVYVVTGFPAFADYPFSPVTASIGAMVAVAALAMFFLTHRDLGRNWSVSLDVRKGHRLVTRGVYRSLRHPMYTAFWMWAVAQALLLPNWIAGLSGITGFGMLYFLRVKREEQLMIETFGNDYRTYMARTKRIIPRVY